MTDSTHHSEGARATCNGQSRKLRLGAIIASDRFRVALQTGLALVLAYGVALAIDWARPHWAGLAIAI